MIDFNIALVFMMLFVIVGFTCGWVDCKQYYLEKAKEHKELFDELYVEFKKRIKK